MQITKKGCGPWAEFSVRDTSLSLSIGEETLSFNCANLQTDNQSVVDVVRTADGQMVEGVCHGTDYIANLIIPPAKYHDVALPVPEGKSRSSEALPGMMEQTSKRERLTFSSEDMAAVKLVLWTLTDKHEKV